ncbi:C40 family peptidase [Desertibacillus haloalkaliphilus]|uniref:C40 family peptidase n=1 Tax=Desertibacillus haloalkaliphilus TaxID=1328930 RepID=UPI001C25C4CD|nr:peptidoglycan-binding protein [Desertibacillus haloalkaliphilus]MBU8905930.1 peptidoglycan-binding protein [Desertibacillus haloalkaliphilus]
MQQRSFKKVVLSSTFATGVALAAPIAADAALGDQTLKKGMTHEDVKQLQDILKAEGYFTYHTSTGYYGTITEEAVKAFQKEHRIQQTGIAGPQTLGVLLGQTDSAPASTEAPISQKLLKAGMNSEAVKDLQRQLTSAGYFSADVTGFFGRVTTSAVKEFQRDNGLTVDGVAGPRTFATLAGSQAETRTVVYQPETQVSAGAVYYDMLRRGISGEQVKDLQEQLKELGFYNGSISGEFDSRTETAVKAFQRQQSITVDGIAGPQTLSALEDAINPPPEVETPDSSLSIGSRGQAVTTLQQQLRQLGIFKREPTGYYGEITAEAVRTFQRQNGLSVTGTVDQTTQGAITEQAMIDQVDDQGVELEILDLVADAAELLGTPYVWGGTTTDGFDCSGFLVHVFDKQGISLPRTVAAMWERGKNVNSPAVGDLVFFETYTDGPSHAGIYIGNHQFVHSGSSTGVTVSSLETNYWDERYLGVKRIHE